MKLKDIRPNPNNPRIIRDAKFEKLKKSIQDFPKMLSLRPIVVDADGRFWTEIPRLPGQREKIDNEYLHWIESGKKKAEGEKDRLLVKLFDSLKGAGLMSCPLTC